MTFLLLNFYRVSFLTKLIIGPGFRVLARREGLRGKLNIFESFVHLILSTYFSKLYLTLLRTTRLAASISRKHYSGRYGKIFMKTFLPFRVRLQL